MAQRGNFDVEPSRSRRAMSSSLMTTPSVSNGRPCRASIHSRQNVEHGVDAVAAPPVRLDRQPPARERLERGAVRRQALLRRRLGVDQLIDERAEAARRDQLRIERPHRAGGGVAGVGEQLLSHYLTAGEEAQPPSPPAPDRGSHRARRGVARIGEDRLPGLLALAVDARERRPRQEDLAAHFDPRPGRREAQRQRADGADVGGDVLALDAVAAGHAADQRARRS